MQGSSQDTYKADSDGLSSPSWSRVSSVHDLSETGLGVNSDSKSLRTSASSSVHFAEDWTGGVPAEGPPESGPSSPSERPGRQRSTASFLVSSGTVAFTVEDADYTVDRVLLKGLPTRWTEAVHAAGDEPIDLTGVKRADFELLVNILSNKGRFTDADLTIEECVAILRISSVWPLDKLDTLSVDRLDTLITNPAHRIKLGRTNGMEDWVDQGLSELSVRKEAPSILEAQSLEKDDLLFLVRVRPLAQATEKEDSDFHTCFPELPKRERLLTWYSCAFAGRILLQGTMYITKCHICFHSPNFGQTLITIAFTDIASMEKRNTAKIFPNGIMINTADNQYVFASFLTRDTTLGLLHDLRHFA